MKLIKYVKRELPTLKSSLMFIGICGLSVLILYLAVVFRYLMDKTY